MRSAEPRRSNCGPPSPRPSKGAFPVKKETTPSSWPILSCCTVSPLDVSTTKVSGSGDTLILKPPHLTVCAGVAPRSLETGEPQDDCTSEPSYIAAAVSPTL